MMRVLMSPHAEVFDENSPSGVQMVVENYCRFLLEYGVELVRDDAESFDLVAVHAGAAMYGNGPLFHFCHGLYWSADYFCSRLELRTNADVIDRMRRATTVSTPSEWVAETIRRDMHIDPVVIPHGINFDEWEPGDDLGYVLWNKNRSTDACDPTPLNQLASLAPKQRFLTTFAADNPTPNVRMTGRVPHADMKKMIQGASVYLSTTKETWGISTVEALAAGVPVLGLNFGGTAELVEHGVTGYLAQPYNYEDLLQGLEYCLKHRNDLGANARESARQYTWENTCKLVADQCAVTLERAQARYRPMKIDPALYQEGGNEIDELASAAR